MAGGAHREQRKATVEFDNPRLEYRRLFSEVWGAFLVVLVAVGGGVIAVTPNWLLRDGLIRPRYRAPVTVSRGSALGNDPTNQEVISKLRDTPIHGLDYSSIWKPY